MKNRLIIIFVLLLTSLPAANPVEAVNIDESIHQDLQRPFEKEYTIPQGSFKFQKEFETAATKYKLPLPFILSVARGESFFNPNAKSAKGAIGLMQIIPGTAQRYGYSADDLKNPAKNIDAGVHYLADLYQRFQDPYLVLSAYYCGEGALEKDAKEVRGDCNDYVKYIHTHYVKVMTIAMAGEKEYASTLQHFTLARFTQFTVVKRFMARIKDIVPEIKMDMFREEVMKGDILQFDYQVLVSYQNEQEKSDLCKLLEQKTGFQYCQ